MRKEKTLEEIQSIVSKDRLESLYFFERKNKLEICSILGVCEDSLNKMFKFYNIEKRSNKYNSADWLKENINIEDFKKYYNHHNIKDTALKYNTTVNIITKFCKLIGFTKTKENIQSHRSISRSKIEAKKFQQYLNILPKNKFYQLHIVENKTQAEIAQLTGLSTDFIYKLAKYYNIHRDRSSIFEAEMNKRYAQFGGKQSYIEHFLKTREGNWIKKYGSLESLWVERQGRIEATNIEKLGVPYVMSDPAIRSKQSKSSKISKLEKRFEEFLINNKFTYLHHYMVEGTPYNHEFDFAIFNSQGNLDVLIDCDGKYYHGYENDENGKTINTYMDDYRSSLVPEGVKFLICLEGEEEKAFSELLSLINISYEEYLNNVFTWCREVEFPYPEYKKNILLNSFKSLCKADINKFSMKAKYGIKIIDHFHPSIWKANKNNCLSPYNAWQDDTLLMKSIKNRVIYKGCNLDRSKVLSGFSIAKIAPKVSVFNPYLSKYIVEKYLSQYNEIFDPCSGYSGRMLGVCALGKRYIGQDINPITVEESNKIIEYFNLNANVECKDLLQDDNREYECLFTCTPYSLKEQWDQEIEDKSCDEWIDEILSKYKCKRYIFVVDKTDKYSQYIVEELNNKSHLNNDSKEYIIMIDR